MPVGAILGAGATIGSALLSKSSTNKSISSAENINAQNNAATNALAREFMGKAETRSSPFINQGLDAGNVLSSYLGLPSGASTAMMAPQTSTFAYPPSGGYTAPSGGSIAPAGLSAAGQQLLAGLDLARNPGSFGGYKGPGGVTTTTGGFAGQPVGGGAPSYQQPSLQQPTPQPSIPVGQAGDPFSQFLEGGGLDSTVPNPQTMQSGYLGTAMDPGSFDDFRESTGYEFRLGEGLDSVAQMFAGTGAFDSGASREALLRYGQDYGSNEYQNYRSNLGDFIRYNDAFAQGERGYSDSRGDYRRAYEQDVYRDYLDRLFGQQGMGLSAANALSGVGTNYVGQVTGNNNSAAQVAANAAIARGAANNQMYADIGQSFGSVLGGIKF